MAMVHAEGGPAPAAGRPDRRPFRRAGERLQLADDRRPVVGREGQDLHVAVPVDRELLGSGLLEHAVEIAAAEAEGADGRAPRLVAGIAARAGPPRSGGTASRRDARLSDGRRTFKVGGSTL